jgi:hypothetical protein
MKLRKSGMLLVALLLAGCWQKSVHPFYTAKDLVAEPGLGGTWTEHKEDAKADDDRMTWTFNDTSDKRWDLVLRDGKEKHDYDAHVFKLDGERYLDIVARDRGVSTIPAHHLFRILESGATLKVAPLNTGFVRNWLKEHPAALAHVIVVDPEHRDDRDSDDLVLTADTRALQGFIRQHLKNNELFAEPKTLKK